MIGRVSGRRTFTTLLREGRRAQAGPLGITVLVDTSDRPCVAFSVGRAVGTAVERNRLRRQLRHLFADLARTRPDLVPPGTYLVSVRRGGWRRSEAESWLIEMLSRLRSHDGP